MFKLSLDMLLDFVDLLVLGSALGNLFLLLVILSKASRNRTNRFFQWAVFTVFVWCVAILLHRNSPPEIAVFSASLLYAAASLVPVGFYFFALHFPDRQPSKYYSLLIITINVIIFGLCFIPNAIISRVDIGTGVGERVIGWGSYYVLFVIYQNLIFLLYFFELYKLYRNSFGRIKSQVILIWIGTFFSVFVAFMTNLFLPTFGYFQLNWLGQVFAFVWTSFVTYAIVRHRLMDIRLAIRKGITTILVVFSVLVLYVSLYLLYIYFYDTIVNPRVFALLAIVAFLTVYLVGSIHRSVNKLTDKFLFSAIYDHNKLLRDLGMVLSSTVGFKDVLPKLYELLSNAMHVKHVTFALSLHKRVDMPIDLVQKKGEYALYHFGEFCRRAALPSYLEKVVPAGQKALLYDDLAYVESKKLDRSALRLKKWMDEQEIGVILPLSIKDELIGYMIVGEKKNGDAFTSEDIGVLETFAMQAAIGIENILLFMYSRDFNKRLSISVEQATAQLKEKNRTLELLRKMDSIITTTLEQDDVCQKAVDTLSWELGYDIAYLSLLDQETGRLVPRAIAHTPIGEKAAAIFAGYEYSFEVDVADQGHPIARVFQTGVRFETEHLTEVFAARVPDVILGQLHEIHEIRGVFVLPIYAKQRVVGTLIVTFPEVPDKVSQAEREILDEFVKEVGIALDNAMLYEEVKRANQALIDTNKRLIELDRMKDEFVSIASHELRTPMTAINSYVWMALNKGGELPAKARDYLDKVSISTQRLISLVEDMLSVSRIESGRVKIELINFELTALIAEVVEELQIKAHERSLELIFEGSEKEFVVHGDKNKTREVLTNLVGNALKFTDHGKVTITVREHGGMMEVSVIDTGRGIAESDMQRLFTKFGRLENELSTIAQTHGTGLGLYICKKYMEAMHGEIGVESKLGEGSRFWFRLSKGDVA